MVPGRGSFQAPVISEFPGSQDARSTLLVLVGEVRAQFFAQFPGSLGSLDLRPPPPLPSGNRTETPNQRLHLQCSPKCTRSVDAYQWIGGQATYCLGPSLGPCPHATRSVATGSTRAARLRCLTAPNPLGCTDAQADSPKPTHGHKTKQVGRGEALPFSGDTGQILCLSEMVRTHTCTCIPAW